MDIKQFLNKLSSCTQIDFSGREFEMKLLAQKYDKNQNSVFEKDELQDISSDISVFMNAEGNPDEMNDKEMSYFYQSLLNKNVTQIAGNLGTMTTSAESLLYKLIGIGVQNKKDIIQKYLDEIGNKREFSESEMEQLLTLDNEALERAGKYLFYVDDRKEQLPTVGICDLAKLNEKELEKIKKFMYIEGRGDFQLEAYELQKIVSLNDEQYEWLCKYIDKFSNIPGTNLTNIAKIHSKALSNFLAKHSKFYLSSYHLRVVNKDGVITFCDNGVFYTFDKMGQIEEKKVESLDNKTETKWIGKISDLSVVTVYNKRLNVKQKIFEGKAKDSNRTVILKEELFYYDNNGSVIKTVTAVRDLDTGNMNVTETDMNGEQTLIQWQSVDPNTGAEITERHFTSPEGVKTDYYVEESDKLKITDYKITDKDGKELINVHQTFERVSDNKFISSINTTGNPKDTQIYEIEYTEDNKIRIHDKKNNKMTVINLSDHFDDEEVLQKMLPTIKQLPGQVLLEFLEKPIKFVYNKDILENANWNSADAILTVGNFRNTEELLAAITHELGHCLDGMPENGERKISNHDEIVDIYRKELKQFLKSTTTEQQNHIDYFINENGGMRFFDPKFERVAETHSLLYSTDMALLNIRRLYFAQYFPRTIAAITKVLLEEEGVKS
ncbi:MAG: hypothetical protein MJ237_00565 [bacterium]|nr:hypothetical protein [bacterium]